MIRSRNIVAESVIPAKLTRSYRRGKYIYAETFDQPSVYRVASSVMAFPTASQGQTDYVQGMAGRHPYYFEMYQTTAQTLMPAYAAASGVEIALDQVDNESVEYVLGGNSAQSPFARVIGTDKDFCWKAKFKLEDASFSDQFGIFLRKQETFAVPLSFLTTGDPIYTDIVLFGFAGTKADPNQVRISTDVGNGGSATVTATGFTWADGVVHELEIRVIGGKPYFFINGVQIGGGTTIALDGDGGAISAQATTPGPSYTFTSGLTIVPGIFCRQDADVGQVWLRSFEFADLADRGLDPNNEVNA